MSSSESSGSKPYSDISISVLLATLDHLEDAVVVTTVSEEADDCKICYVNSAFARISGYAHEDLLGQSLSLLHGPGTDTDTLLRLQAGDATRCESLNHSKDGSAFAIQWRVFPATGEGTHAIGIHRDTSRIHRLQEDLIQAQKMDAVGRLARGIAHDFNNLLAVIMSFSELLLERPESQDSLTSFATEIHKAAKRAAMLTAELMAFSRRESAEPELLELCDILSQMIRIIRRIIPENIEVVAFLPDESVYVRINRAALERALVHLTTNARDALPSGGKITVSLERLNEAEAAVRMPENAASGPYALIAYSDNGIGMNTETVSKAFEPFFTTKPVGKGTGLGLSTTYATVTNSNGHIEIKSEVDEGTRVTISLPCESIGTESAQPDTLSVRSSSTERVPVLVVEDDAGMRDCITGVLSIYCFEVFSASSAEEALEKFADRAGSIQVLLTDIVLPRMNGADLAQRFLERNPQIKILYMTGYDDESIRLDTLPGKTAVLRKPFSLNQVLTLVEGALDRP